MTGSILFSDQAREPGVDELHSALGEAAGRWERLVGAAESMGARGEWSWNGPKYGWGWRMKRAGKPFVSLDPRQAAFSALIVLGREHSEQAAQLPLGPRMRATYDAARQFPDGRWLFHPVETEEDVRDLLTLLRLKLPPTIRRRLEAESQEIPAGRR